MYRLLVRYTRWLHSAWPAGTVERLPVVGPDGETNVEGLRIAGDLTGVPLLKFAADSGARAVRAIAAEASFERAATDHTVSDLVIVGAGVAGIAAYAEAKKSGLGVRIIDSSEALSTLVNFPRGKPIYTYPTDMEPAGELSFSPQADTKERLIEELREFMARHDIEAEHGRVDRVSKEGGTFRVDIAESEPIRARRVLIAIGRSGEYRRLGVPGEDLDKVSNRLHDPAEFKDRRILVVGGGDTAAEMAIALCEAGAEVTLAHRGAEISRAKPENVARLSSSGADGHAPRLLMNAVVKEIGAETVDVEVSGKRESIPNDHVFLALGRAAPLEFLRRCGIKIHGERGVRWWTTLILFLVFCTWLYHWKKSGVVIADMTPLREVARIGDEWASRGWFPYGIPDQWRSLGEQFADRRTLAGTLAISLGEPGFYYSLAYCIAVLGFGIDRIRRRRTPYVKRQTWTLIAIQCVPLFLLPYLILPFAGNRGWFDEGVMRSIADALFPVAGYGHGREYWRAFGLILAWPLFIWNAFTDQPLTAWLAISFVQTFIAIPLIVRKWGKGAYCGWICSCGALAETLGDRHREKMPHGRNWNRANMIGQVFLAFALILMILRTASWIAPASWAGSAFRYLLHDAPIINYVWFVDLFWAGVVGVGLYFWFSGRVWCRFACPLAALMHIYARFGRFRILADKKKCISCNVCTTVCHQGIDVMGFANQGKPMEDPECVRCSACVQSCPTGVLTFGEVDPKTGAAIRTDRIAARRSDD